ncbi:hypothetical protein E2C01_006070 [Portunus trituberculatus]|uniref:Uncharacterized protein n=1 Tax=Portunus trituberculatus TaxID=210409 RepID=A0A5B7CVB1_PORTR|nr:hypothetical protein [Portunus trituberculatus]
MEVSAVVVMMVPDRSAMVSGSGLSFVSLSVTVNTPATTPATPKINDGNHGNAEPCGADRNDERHDRRRQLSKHAGCTHPLHPHLSRKQLGGIQVNNLVGATDAHFSSQRQCQNQRRKGSPVHLRVIS